MGKSGIDQPRLFAYGIQTEQSDIRCHVSPISRLVFIFKTAEVLKLFANDGHLRYREVFGYQPGIQYHTGAGRAVPLREIPDLRVVQWWVEPWWENWPPEKGGDTSKKGAKAVDVAIRLMRAGRFPLWISDAADSSCVEVQRGGTDILLWGKWRIQVKADYKAGPCDGPLVERYPVCRGSGNLFIQTAESNPLKRV